jgi:hypothetical protein
MVYNRTKSCSPSSNKQAMENKTTSQKAGKQNNRFQGEAKVEDLTAGTYVVNVFTGRLCKVLDKTTNSIEVYDMVDINYSMQLAKKGQQDEDGEVGMVRGISARCWYDLENFNRKFDLIHDVSEYKLRKLSEWVDLKVRRKTNLAFNDFI